MVEIAFIGLCLFLTAGSGGPIVVIPDFSTPTCVDTKTKRECVESHTAYIGVNKDDVLHCDGCVLHKDTQVFSLEGGELTVEGISGPDFHPWPNKELIPSIEKNCPAFRLFRPLPVSATTLHIDKGALRAEKMMENGKATDERYSILTVNTNTGITFTARNGHKLVLKPPTGKRIQSVSISNISVNRFNKRPSDRMNHWLAFYSLSADKVFCDLPKDPADPKQQTTIACSNGTLP